MDDQDDQGNTGRSGRVRKKSAKVLEMEEFEQAEKVSHTGKKAKLSKGSTPNVASLDDSESSDKMSGKKNQSKLLKSGSSNLESTPSSKNVKLEGTLFNETPRSVPAELTLRVPTNPLQAPQSQILSTKVGSQTPSTELKSALPISPPVNPQSVSIKTEDAKSVIKYLLSSPTAGSTSTLASNIPVTPAPDSQSTSSSTPKTTKKQKSEEKKSKLKEKRPKIEIMSPAELISASSAKSPVSAPSLKLKITGGSNPSSAQVALNLQDTPSETAKTAKPKKAPKKVKVKTDGDNTAKPKTLGLAGGDGSPPMKKPKVSKKKEKLIQDAISAVTNMPNLAALVTASGGPSPGLTDLSPPAQKAPKKKPKTPPVVTSDSLVEGDFDDDSFDVEPEESTLVIAEKEKKKKKVLGKKKGPKEKEGVKEEKTKKIPKRAPTAYMLFCNTHRASIVADNPGIEFAGISRKLGELWQAQSNKQKLQWRRKAQRRMKKSNLISTGKIGKESQGANTHTAATLLPQARLTSTQKLSSFLQRPKGALLDEAPLSPTKVGIEMMLECDENSNFSIEPMDVAAHLKLLGESLSIIGMRLQEHKGMIAVQGSLSVLLDSLICACGPLLCLTQQVPGMDGCTPSMHAQTLDSVAYVMPGL